jgi:glycosyltransferase involved in cell wall biosynthesis
VPDVSPSFAVIRAEPDGYDMAKTQLMGRQAAGHGFLRAAVAARGDCRVRGFAVSEAAAKRFEAMVAELDPGAPFEWIPPLQLARVRESGTLYLADATVASHARQRQRVGLAAFSLCGVTHTIASPGAMDEIANLLREPVAPWDALICTSSAVVEAVQRIHQAEADYLRWRFGPQARISGPQLPLIPLGVHCDDFEFDDSARARARSDLGISDDEVVALFVGRLVFHAKAHPFPMFRALQLAAERTGKRIALVLSGWAPNAAVEQAFRSGAAQFAPDVRLILVEGRDADARPRTWAAADLFVSLSDNIQETFGLTPIEAMAAALPVVVTDWDGYRDTVRHEIDGFRLPVWSPAAGAGAALAAGIESRAINYDHYCWSAAAATAVEIEPVAEAIGVLVTHPRLRRTMGQSGRARARELFDWPVVFRQYQALWAELDARRRAATEGTELGAWSAAIPAAAAARLDPFYAFEGYADRHIAADTRVRLSPHADAAALKAHLGHPLFSGLSVSRATVEKLFALLAAGETTVAEAATALRLHRGLATRITGLLAKMDLVRLG